MFTQGCKDWKLDLEFNGYGRVLGPGKGKEIQEKNLCAGFYNLWGMFTAPMQG